MGVTFKASEVPAQSNEYAPITPGQYNVQMDEVQEKETLSGGVSWSLKMKIVGPESIGRTFFLNYNVENSNAKTQEIARREIAEIAALVGAKDDISIETIKTNKVFSITLEQRPVGDKIYYNAKSWKLANEAASIKKVQDALPTTKTSKKPWENK